MFLNRILVQVMKKTLKYFFSTSVLCFLFISANSQTERIKGLRLGIDISRFSLYYFDPGRTCFQVSADFEAIDNLYPIIEYGQQTVSLLKYGAEGSQSNLLLYNYKSQGSYYRIGADYNFLKSKAHNQYDMVFLGFRIGYANMKHSAEDISIDTVGSYWGQYTGGTIPQNNIKAYWIEVTPGIRAEIFKNFFMGWSISGRIMLKQSKDDYMDPYNIPGYGNGSSKTGIGFNYSIFYRIPIFKEKIKIPVTKEKK